MAMLSKTIVLLLTLADSLFNVGVFGFKCGPSKRFEATVSVIHTGLVTVNDIPGLELAFIQAYNTLKEDDKCSPRIVTGVNVDPSSLVQLPPTLEQPLAFRVVYTAQVLCQEGCPSGFVLFEEKKKKKYYYRRLQSDDQEENESFEGEATIIEQYSMSEDDTLRVPANRRAGHTFSRVPAMESTSRVTSSLRGINSDSSSSSSSLSVKGSRRVPFSAPRGMDAGKSKASLRISHQKKLKTTSSDKRRGLAAVPYIPYNGIVYYPSMMNQIAYAPVVIIPVCGCKFGPISPSPSSFVTSFNAVLRSRSSTSLSSIFVSSVQELQAVACKPVTSGIRRSIVVDHTGDLSKLTATERVLLNELFLKSYNLLTFSVCDPQFRFVTAVTFGAAFPNDEASAGSFRARYDIVLECRGCDPETTDLLARPRSFTRHLLEGEQDEEVMYSSFDNDVVRHLLSGATETCFCPAYTFKNGPPVPKRAPLVTEFVDVFDTAVVSAVERGFLTSVLGVAGITDGGLGGVQDAGTVGTGGTVGGTVDGGIVGGTAELSTTAQSAQLSNVIGVSDAVDASTVGCGVPMDEFTSTIFVDVAGDPSQLASERLALGFAFQTTYNNLVQTTCDPRLRTLVDVNVDFASGPPAPSSTTTQFFRLRFDVTGICVGCASNADLFDNGASVPIAETLDCTCVNSQPPRRPPTQEEFFQAYNTTSSALNMAGQIQSVQLVQATTEVNPFPCSTDISTFQAFFLVDIDTDALSELEIEVLEAIFLSSYNRLDATFCDLRFRALTRVEVLGRFQRRLQAAGAMATARRNATFFTGRNSTSFRFSSRATYGIVVDGFCRGCRRGINATDDGFRRRFLEQLGENARVLDFQMKTRKLQPSEEEDCFCPAINPVFGGPTEEELGSTFSMDVQALQTLEQAILQDVDVDEDIVEVSPIACGATRNEFQSSVILDIDGANLAGSSSLSSTDQSVLESAFGESFNRLNSLFLCDAPSFRSISDVSLTVLEVDNGNLTLPQECVSTGRLRVRLDVTATCRDCAPDTNLFDVLPSGQTRRLSVDSSPRVPFLSNWGRNLALTDVFSQDCLCPTRGVELRGPTQSEFMDSFTESIQIFQSEQSLLGNVMSVSNVMELEDVSCVQTLTPFESDVFVDFSGDPDLLTMSDRDYLAESLRQTYNIQGATFCDPFFRVIDEVLLIDDFATNSSTTAADAVPQFRFQYRVRGQCRGCSDGDPFFSDPATVASNVTPPIDDQSTIFSRTQCLCRSDAVFRPPTPGEFTSLYAERVRDLQECGAISTTEVGVANVVEVEEVNCSPFVTSFEAFIEVEFQGDIDLLTQEELLLLADSLRTSYNLLPALLNICDTLFRRVVSVDILEPGEVIQTRRLQRFSIGNLAPSTSQRNSSVGLVNLNSTNFGNSFSRRTVRLRGRCRGCFLDTAISNRDNDGIARSLEAVFPASVRVSKVSETHYHNSDERSLQMLGMLGMLGDGNFISDEELLCFCPPGSDLRAPTEGEITSAYANTVDAVQEDGLLGGVDVGTVDGDEASVCLQEGLTLTFNSTISLDAEVTILDASQLELVEMAFIATYNALSRQLCDPLFRTLSSASISGFPGSIIQFMLVGDCPGCVGGESFFFEGNPDPFLDAEEAPLVSLVPEGRTLIDVPRIPEECLCTTENPEFRAPTREEFAAAFTTALIGLGVVLETPCDFVDLGSTVSIRVSGSSDPAGLLATAFLTSFNDFRNNICASLARTATMNEDVQDGLAESGELELGLVFSLGVAWACSLALETSRCTTDALLLEIDVTAFLTAITEELQANGLDVQVLDIAVDGTFAPSAMPTNLFSSMPSATPTDLPSSEPSSLPSSVPSVLPTSSPSDIPSEEPSVTPSASPSASPSIKSSVVPSASPSETPSSTPSVTPSTSPSKTPSDVPSLQPSSQPSSQPSAIPSAIPSTVPSALPSTLPSTTPSAAPSMILCDGDAEEDNEVAFEDFNDFSVGGWQNGKIDDTEIAFTPFLGRYFQNDDMPSRTLTVERTSSRLLVFFTFYEIDSWDGNGRGGPDRLVFQVSGSQQDTIDFGWFNDNFNEPSRTGVSSSGSILWSRTSSPSDGSIGFELFPDQIHRISLEIPRSFFINTGSVTITLDTSALQGAADESIGIDNFRAVECLDFTPSASPSASPSFSPIAEAQPLPPIPTPPPVAPTQSLLEFLQSSSPTPRAALIEKPGTPQNKAFTFLQGNEDDRGVFTSKRRLQRFALLTFLFAGEVSTNQIFGSSGLDNECNSGLISCGKSDANGEGCVTSLTVSGWKGKLPDELTFLNKLEKLNLSGNKIRDGQVPHAYMAFTQLKELDLSSTHLTHYFPAVISSLTSLKKLDLSNNNLSGKLKSRLRNLRKLRELDLSHNSFKDKLPSELGSLPDLRRIDISKNSLFGSLPPSIGSLKNLEELLLQENKFGVFTKGIGIPAEYGMLSHLRSLRLEGKETNFKGTPPSEVCKLVRRPGAQLTRNNFRIFCGSFKRTFHCPSDCCTCEGGKSRFGRFGFGGF